MYKQLVAGCWICAGMNNPGYMSVKYGYFYYIYRVEFDVGNEADA